MSMTATHRVLAIGMLPPELKARLARDFDLLERKPTAGEMLPGFPVAVTTSMAGIDAATIAALPDLKLLGCNGAGLERIDTDALAARGIALRHTPDAVTEDTADLGLALIFALLRRVTEADRFVRSNGWATGRMSPSSRISGHRLGIVGLGKIGQTLAGRAALLGMPVSYTGPREKPDQPYRYLPDLLTLARECDILALTCRAGPETDRMIDARVLDALGPRGYLINIARGSVVEEEALIAALTSGSIAGAALDVFDHEPNIDPRFAALENVVLTPHYAAVTRETREAMAEEIATAIAAFYAGATGQS